MKIKKRILISVCALVFTMALATSATYAWFTMNDKVEVGSVDIDVTTGSEGLFISTDGNVYDSSLTKTQIEALYSQLFTKGYTAVTSTNGADFYKKDGATKVNPNSAASTSTEGTYVSFQLYFRSTAAMDIYLNGNTFTTTGDDLTSGRKKYAEVYPVATKPANNKILAWNAKTLPESVVIPAYEASKYGTYDALNTIDKIAEKPGFDINARGANATRLSFVSYDYTAANPDTSTPASWDKPEAGVIGDATSVWNPNASRGYFKENMAWDYLNAIQGKIASPITATLPTANDLVATSTDGVTTIPTGANAKPVATTTAAGDYFEACVEINIWLEGWDGDCMNDIFSDKFYVALGFLGVKEGYTNQP